MPLLVHGSVAALIIIKWGVGLLLETKSMWLSICICLHGSTVYHRRVWGTLRMSETIFIDQCHVLRNK